MSNEKKLIHADSDFFRSEAIIQYKISQKYANINKFTNIFEEKFALNHYTNNKLSTLFVDVSTTIDINNIKNHKSKYGILLFDIKYINDSGNFGVLQKAENVFVTNTKMTVQLNKNNVKYKYIAHDDFFISAGSFVLENMLCLNDMINNNIQDSNIIISLTTIPPRLIDINNFTEVIESLYCQILKPKYVIVNICEKYKRKFDVDIELFKNCVEYYKTKFNNLIFNYSEDYGPITKILGLYDVVKLNININDDDVILVVDDDYKQNNTMTYYYQYVYQLYNCDAVAVDFINIMEQKIKQKNNTNILFYDNYCGFIYGYLSFSFKFKYIKILYDFYCTIIKEDDFIFYHDDLILTLFYRIYNIYICGINLYFREKYTKELKKGEIPLDERTTLRYDNEDTRKKRLNTEEKFFNKHGIKYNEIFMHKELIYDESQKIIFEMKKNIPERNLLYCVDNVDVEVESYDFQKYHIDAKYFSQSMILITITNFAKCKENLFFTIKINDIRYNYNINLESKYNSDKFSLIFDLNIENIDAFCQKIRHEKNDFKIMQTTKSNIVTRNKFYSICTILSNLPDIKYILFDDNDVINYIKNNNSDILQYHCCY
jgi:hypothetical protein